MKYLYLSLAFLIFSVAPISANSLLEAQALIQAKQYDSASKKLDALTNVQDIAKDEVQYYKARVKFLAKDYANARSAAEQLIANFGDSEWRSKAEFLIGDTYHREGRHEEAAKVYKSQLAEILKEERKVEIAKKLISYADDIAAEKKEGGIVIKQPDYNVAYNLYKEVLEIECGSEVREQTRLKMIRCKRFLKQYPQIEVECLSYLAEFDKSWRGKIGSLERITDRRNMRFINKGNSVEMVRYWLAESLHRQNKRSLATVYLNELIKQSKDGTLLPPKGLLADAEWLRLFTLTSGSRPNDLTYWTTEARAFLQKYPTNINSIQTANYIPYFHVEYGDIEEGKKLYQEFIDNALGAKVVKNPETTEEEDEKAFTSRQQDASDRREKALKKLGQLHLNSNDFEKAQSTWNTCLKEYPNGKHWSNIQKSISQIGFDKLLYSLNQLPSDRDTNQTITTATKLIDEFIEANPLHSNLIELLYHRGGIPYNLAQKELDKDNEVVAKELLKKAISGWEPLLQRFPNNTNSKRALEYAGKIFLHHLDDLDKGVEFLQRADKNSSIVQILKSEVLRANTPKIFTLDEEPYVDLETRNIKEVKVKLYWMNIESYWEKSANLADATKLDLDLIEPDKQWDYTIEDYKKLKLISSKLKIPFDSKKTGFCVIKVESEKFESTSVIQRSNLDLAVRSSERDIVAYVKNAATNKPEKNASVFIASNEKIIMEGKTDEKGIFYSELSLPEGHNRYRVLVKNSQGAAASSINGVHTVSSAKDEVRGWFVVDRNEVRPGDLIKVNAVVRDLSDGEFTYPKERDYQLTVYAGSTKLIDKPITLTEEGHMVEQVRIPTSTKSDSIRYTLTQKKNDLQIISSYLPLTKESEFKGSAVLSFENKYAKEGDVLEGKVSAKYRHGGPMALTKFNVILPGGQRLDLITDENGEAEFSYDTLADLAGTSLNFALQFTTLRVYSSTESVTLDPIDLSIEEEIDKAVTVVGESVTLKCATKNFKEDYISSDLEVKVFHQASEETLNILSGASNLSSKLEEVETFILNTTDSEDGASRDFSFDKPGNFHIKITGTDQNGKKVVRSLGVRVLGESSNDKLTIFRDKEDVYDDGEVEMRIFSNLSQVTPVLVSIETHRSIDRKIVSLKKGDNTLKFPLDSRYSPGVTFTILAIDGRELFKGSHFVEVKTKLNLEATYTGIDTEGKAKAGDKVNAKLKITDSNGKEIPAIVLATLNPDHVKELEFLDSIHPLFEVYNNRGNFRDHTSCGFSLQGAQTPLLSFTDDNQIEVSDPIRTNSALSFEHSKNIDRVRRLLYLAEGYYNLGQFDKAETEFNKVLKVDKYNKVARRWLERVSSIKSDYYRSAYDHTRAHLLTEVDAAWESQLRIRSSDEAIVNSEINIEGLNGRNAPNVDYFAPPQKGLTLETVNLETVNVSTGGVINDLSLIIQNFAYSEVSSQLPVWQSPLVSLSSAQELIIPLPDIAGKWKLELHALDKSGRYAKNHTLIHTSSPYTITFKSPSSIVEGDKLLPEIDVFRTNTKETEELTLEVTQGDKTINEVLKFEVGTAVTSVKLASLTGKAGDSFDFTAKITGKDLERSHQVTVKAWGAVVVDQAMQAVPAGQAKWIDLNLGENTTPDTLVLSISTGFDSLITDLAVQNSPSDFWCVNPLKNDHPSGKLIALVSALEYLEKRKEQKSEVYKNLLQSAQWTYDELITQMHNDGYWTESLSTRFANLRATTYSHIALVRWQSIGGSNQTAINKSGAYLQGRFANLGINDFETRAFLQMALAYNDRADFSECNRLQRNSAKLTAAAKLYLAKAFILQDRPNIATEIMNGLLAAPINEWTANSAIAKRSSYLLGNTVEILSTIQYIPAEYAKHRELLLKEATSDISNSYIRGAVVSGLAEVNKKLEGQNALTAKGKGSIYLGDKKVMDFDLSDKDVLLNKVLTKDLTSEAKLKIEFTGQSQIFAHATIIGNADSYQRHTPLDTVEKRSGIYERLYYYPRRKHNGKTLSALGTTTATAIHKGEEVLVRLKSVNRSDDNRAVIIEPIPSGFKYVKGSFRGKHNGVIHEDGRLVIKFNGNFDERWLSYKIVAVEEGEWRQQPTAMIHLADADKPLYANDSKITVLALGATSPDIYTYNERELLELALLYFQDQDYRSAEEKIQQLLLKPNAELTKEIAKIQLWIENDKAEPNAKKIIESFETLDALDPDLDVPFSVVGKVASAYASLGEHERAFHVYNALIDGSFQQDTYVAIALEKQKRFLDAVDVMKDLWQRYPESDTVGSSYFVYSQNLYASAPNIKKLTHDDPEKKNITKEDIYEHSIELLQSYLSLYPEHPSADEAAYTICNGRFTLKDYESVVAQAKVAVEAYPKSKLHNSFRYMVALGSFWQLKFDEAIDAAKVVADGDSEDKDLATFIIAQILHAQGKASAAKEWYELVKDVFPDASTSLDYFDQKKLNIEEITLLDSKDKVSIDLEHRNVNDANITIYKVDLMKLYLKHRNLSKITSINLAGIEPDFSFTQKLKQSVATSDETTKVNLPIKEDGAYLVICQGDYKYSSGLILKSPLKIEIQELQAASKIRVNVKEKTTGKLLNGVHIKAIGSSDAKFQKGDTDLRGIWESNALSGRATIIARDKQGRYAFYRGEKVLSGQADRGGRKEDDFKLDYNYNGFINQQELIQENRVIKEKFLEKGKKKNFKVKEILKK